MGCVKGQLLQLQREVQRAVLPFCFVTCCGLSHAGFGTTQVQLLCCVAACLMLGAGESQRRFAVGPSQCWKQNLRLSGGSAFIGH